MTNPTSNFGWQMPTSTDLVTDLPADFETFGQAVDTTLAELKGGTTGQVLSKTSNANMDFTWVTTDDANAIQNSIVDAKGDLIAASANDTPARLGVGSNGSLLMADSSTATGLKWSFAPWATWTPGYNGITVGNGTVIARYSQIGATMNAYFSLKFGSTTSLVGNLILISLPNNASSNYLQYDSIMGTAKYTDSGTAEALGYMDWYNNFYGVRLLVQNTSGTYATTAPMSPTVPWTWATGDCISFNITYEVAI